MRGYKRVVLSRIKHENITSGLWVTWGYDKTERQKIIKSLVKTIVTIVGSFFKQDLILHSCHPRCRCQPTSPHTPHGTEVPIGREPDQRGHSSDVAGTSQRSTQGRLIVGRMYRLNPDVCLYSLPCPHPAVACERVAPTL